MDKKSLVIRVLHILLELELLYISRIAESAETLVSMGSGAIPEKKRHAVEKRGPKSEKKRKDVTAPPS